MHSNHSCDATATMEAMVLSAIHKNLKIICFTEHLDFDFPDGKNKENFNFLVDIPTYQEELIKLKEKYINSIEILFGIELGLMPYLAPRYEKIVREFSFDFIIGSSHLVNGEDPYQPAFFQNVSKEEAYYKYFGSIVKNINSFKCFSSYGHLDYIIRYAPNTNAGYSYSKYADILDEILKSLIENGKALEINTSGFNYGLNQPHPHFDIIRRYRQLKGELITIGSDAHKPEGIGYRFKEIDNFLTMLGYRYYTIYRNNSPCMISL